MADITKKMSLLIIILVMSLFINLGIGITSMAINSSNNISFISETGTNKTISGSGSNILLGLIGIPSFFIPYVSVLSLYSLNLPTEIFVLLTAILTIFETIKTALYILMIISIIPTENI